MRGVRIHWKGVAKASAAILVGLIALQLAPRLLATPDPPPLPADVGLPRVQRGGGAAAEPVVLPERAAKAISRSETDALRPKGTTRSRRRRARVVARPQRPEPSAAATPAETVPATALRPEPAPAPAAAAVPAAPPEPAPSAPVGDGSEEFAPR